MNNRQEYKTVVTVVPAAPGFFELRPESDRDGRITGAARHPIIAWVICPDWDCAEMVTLESGVIDYGLVLSPDGQVQRDGIAWPSFDAWLAAQNAWVPI
jgi:hypothetical protein